MADTTGRKLLDLAFAMDCTGSMGSHIEQARQNVKSIAETIIAKEQADVRLALIEYRDHPPQDFREYVTRVLDLTGSVRDMKQRLDSCSAQGGGDTPEAVADALHDLLKLSWREEAAKICVFISDAPPHGLGGCDDGFPNGCPCDLDPMVTARELAAKGITVYMVGCEPSITPYRDWFMAISHITGGQYVPLANANLLPQVIIGGAQEEISLQLLMAEVNADVRSELEALPDGAVAQAAVEKRIYSKMQAKGYNTKHLGSTTVAMPTVSVNARHYSEMGDMKKVSEAHKKNIPAAEQSGRCDERSFGRPMTRAGVARAYRVESEMEVSDSAGAEPETAYTVTEGTVSQSQVSRMVQKALYSNNLKSKCKPDP